MKILATGDWHLGAGTNLGRTPGDRLADQQAVLENILGLACERDVGAILIAGDILNGPIATTEQMDVFAQFIEAASQADIPIVAISGNSTHDLAMRTVNGLAIFNRIPGITVYSRPALHDLGAVQVACVPWVSPARLVASMDGDVDRDRVNDRAAELLVKVASGIADPHVKPTVLMLHGSISGASLPTGIPTDELREPVIDVHLLDEVGFDAIVASHIHVAQLFDRDRGWIPPGTDCPIASAAGVYTGSPLPLSFGETSVPHGVWIIDVEANGTSYEFVPIESRPLVPIVFDIADTNAHPSLVDDVIETLYDPATWPEVPSAIVKVALRCTQAQQRRLDIGRLREAVLAAGAHTVKVDVDTVREQRSRVDGLTGDIDPLDAWDMWASANPVEPELAAAVRQQLQRDLELVGA